MNRFGSWVVKFRIPIIIISLLLLIPSFLGYISTRVNYDILYYLPDDIETVVGQDIMMEDFGKGAFAMLMVDGMEDKDVSELKSKVEDIEHVDSVIWYDSFSDISIPKEFLPDNFYEAFNNGDTTLMAIFFDGTTSADTTMEAINGIRFTCGEQCFLSGMSAFVTDTKALAEQEEPIYVLMAVALACIIMALFLDSWLLPFIFVGGIAIAVLYNLGSNFFLGEVSYITKALSAVLQLGVTMDYSIFLWHSYKECKELNPDKKQAMAKAISMTLSSVVGSSITTIAGFLALCFMSFTLGFDLGIVMAKGVLFGVICCVTVLPSFILTFDKAIEKLGHRPFIPNLKRLTHGLVKHWWIGIAVFAVLIVPALFGYNNTSVYYNLDASLPQDLASVVAQAKLEDEFDMNCTHMILVDSKMSTHDMQEMTKEIEDTDGVNTVLGLRSVIGPSIPIETLPDSVREIFESDRYELLLVNSAYRVASDELNAQIDTLNEVTKKYDENAMVIGEGPCTKDLITITDHDFQVVNVISIAAIFLIIMLVLRSISIPIILVSVIEFAIFINMGIPYYTGTILPFIASIVIGTIQLGATVDYAILMTTRYCRERSSGKSKHESTEIALSTSINSIIVSGLGFFAATFGVGLYSNIDMISSLCSLMARGALISMAVVIIVLPSMFMVFDKFIIHTTLGFKDLRRNAKLSGGIKI